MEQLNVQQHHYRCHMPFRRLSQFMIIYESFLMSEGFGEREWIFALTRGEICSAAVLREDILLQSQPSRTARHIPLSGSSASLYSNEKTHNKNSLAHRLLPPQL